MRYKKLINLYKKSFNVHNIFTLPNNKIKNYLQKIHNKNSKYGLGIIELIKKDELLGALVINIKTITKDNHALIRINHLVVQAEKINQGYGQKLMNIALKKIKSLKKLYGLTVKIEIHVAESEKKAIRFYKKFGFEIEGKIKDHYRPNELVYFLGKSI